MRVIRYLLSPVLILLSVSYALAQTLTANNPPPAPEAAWEIILKLGFPIVMSALGPYATGWITAHFAKVHPSIQYMLTSLITLIAGALVGQIPAFPLSSESAVTMALAAGNTGQFLANSNKAAFNPKTEHAKVVLATLPKEDTKTV